MAVELNASKIQPVEERRSCCTTYSNLKLWFENWSQSICNKVFGHLNEGGNVFIPEEQQKRILNIDESCLALDGNKGLKGGRPSVIFYNRNFNQLEKPATKSNFSTTFITDSTAFGENIPPHFQFSTKATPNGEKCIRNYTIEFMAGINGTFGNDEVKVLPITIGLNEKGGMDDAEFEKYILISIVSLFPDTVGIEGKRVIVKLDSGLGRMNIALLAQMRLLGFVLYPGVLNTTAVTQEADIN